MKAIEIVNQLKDCKGQHVLVTWQRACKVLASCPHVIAKRTSAYIRAGIDYANLATVNDAIALGLRGDVQSLPWGQWSVFPFIINHKTVDYVRLYPASFGNLKPSVEWTIDGVPCTFAQCERFLVSSEKRHEDEKPLCFTVKAQSVLSIA